MKTLINVAKDPAYPAVLPFDPRNVLVTGGLGFIGSWLVRELLRVYDVGRLVIVDNGSRVSPGKIPIPPPSSKAKIYLVHSDLAMGGGLGFNLGHGRDAENALVFHLAARTANIRSIGANALALNAYVPPEIYRGMSSGAFVFASSFAVYGAGSPSITFIEDGPILPVTGYGASKYAAELGIGSTYYAAIVRNIIPVAAFVARLSNVVGPPAPDGGAIPSGGLPLAIYRAGVSGEAVATPAGESPVRDFVDVRDVCSALCWGAASVVTPVPNDSDACASCFSIANVCSGIPHSVSTAIAAAGLREDRLPIERADHDVSWSLGSGARMRSLGWTPRYSLLDSLRRGV